MASNQPTPGREILPAGIDVRKIRKPINDAFRSVPIELIGEGAATSTDGRRMSFTVMGEDAFYVRLDNKTTVNGTVRYGWKAVNQDRANGDWANSPRAGNATTDDWATELNNANLTVGTATRYPARVNPQTGRVTFFQGSGSSSGNVTIKSGETVLMPLGTYDDYKDCPGVPPKPPTTFANLPCSDERTETLCVPAYAYAVYQRCGYVWNKVGDTRDFGVWANELNGGTTSAWRRFVIPRWGGDVDPLTGLPDPDSACMGVAFIGSGASALDCSCPTWASSGQCLKVRYTIIDRPFETGNGGYADCNDVFLVFDAGDAEGPYWGRTFEALINSTGSLCSDGSDGTGPLTMTIAFQDAGRDQCYWGPDVFDPCDPCKGFGRFYVAGELNDVAERPNCGGAGHFTGYLSIEDIADIICNCSVKSLRELVPCSGCDGTSDELPPLYFVDMDSIEITCCDEPEAVYGGDESSAFTESYFGGDETSVITDAIYGGSE